MKPPPFSYAAPTTLAEAVGLLTEHAEAEPRVLAGGQSLIPLMNFRLAKPGYLIDLRHVAGLSGIRREGDTLVIGAMTRMSEVERSAEVAVAAPLLAEAVGLVAHTPVRNRGTVGGSLAHADPAAELPTVALACDAELVAVGPAGSRVLPAAEFITGPFSTALAPDEILTEIRLPVWPGGHAFVEFSRIHANFAVVGVAALVDLDGSRIRRAALALAGVAPTAIRATAAERVLAGADAADVAAAAGEAAGGGRRGPDPGRGPARQPADQARAGPDLPAARDRTGRIARTKREVRTLAPSTCTISLTVNGRRHVAEVEPRRLLVDFLREDLGLPGTHIGCEHGVCGTCTVLLDGASIRSCITFAVQADGAEISTVEGLSRGGELHPLQDEFAAKQALQCGFCTPGMLMRACEILAENPDPTPEQVRSAIASNLCRCTGYQFITEAVIGAAARMRATEEVAS